MKKILFYAMQGEKMCFVHVLLNALQLKEENCEVKIIFEGQAVKLPSVLENENNALYMKAKEQDLIAGICSACSKMLEVYDENVKTGLLMLSDMNGHAGMMPYLNEGYEVIRM